MLLAEAQRAAVALKRVIDGKTHPVRFGGETFLQFEDWQTVYRECLQLRLLAEGVGDPIAGIGGTRFQRDPRPRSSSRRLARRARGLTRETAASSAAKSVITLAQKFAQRMLSPRR